MSSTYREGWMRPKDAAAYFDVAPMTIYRWYYKGQLAGTKLGARILLVDPDSFRPQAVTA